jgi:hypothetical protein
MGLGPFLATFLITSAIYEECDRPLTRDQSIACGVPYAAMVFSTIGSAVAYVAVDAAQLAWTYGPTPAQSHTRLPPRVLVIPSMAAGRSGAVVGFSGAF